MEIALKKIVRSFKTPIVVAGVSNTSKQFLEGEINGRPFELSVLPGLHTESFEQACEQFYQYLDHGDLTRITYPSVRFALEAWLYQEHAKTLVKSNALLLRPDTQRLTQLRNKGYDCFKIKIARGESAHELKDFLAHLQPHEKVRLDGNRLLSPHALEEILQTLVPYWNLIDYIEEPFATLEEHQQWRHRVAIALDESVLLDQTHFHKHVLKPSLYGFQHTLELIESWGKLGHVTTISSAFEGPIALSWLNTLAAKQNSLKPNPAGLGTLEFFAHN